MARSWSKRSGIHRALKLDAHGDYQRGSDVEELQKALAARARPRGFAVIKVDGEYGPATAASVQQVGHALGALDSTLRKGATKGLQRITRYPATRTPAQLARAAARKAKRPPLRLRAFAEAAKDLGVREQGNNRGAEVERIIHEAGGVPGESWCGDSVYVWYKRAGSKSPVRAWAYVPTLQQLLTRVRNPAQGHVVIYEWQGDGTPDHTGLFDAWIDKRAGTFWAIEGNTGPDGAVSDGNGNDGVRRRQRSTRQVASFRRVLR